MFGLPTAKRVRRDEIHSPASSARSSPDVAFEALLRSRAQDEFTFTVAATGDGPLEDAAAGGEGDEETELILFATPTSAAPQTNKIRLESPEAASSTAGFRVKRPQSYYFSEDVTSDKEAQLQQAAVDGAQVVEMSMQPWPGCAMPWKVRTISAAGIQQTVLARHPTQLLHVEDRIQKRTRKGKKTRLALRKKKQDIEARRAEREKLHKEKARLDKEREEADREKRTRRNREKKVKKKAKEKAAKAAAGESEAVSAQGAIDQED